MADTRIENIRRHLETLVGERNPFSSPSALHAAAGYLEHQFRMLNLSVLTEDVVYEGAESKNVLGVLQGEEKGAPPFVVAAHYDTVEGSPGADDNASAVAALLEIARLLGSAPLKAPLIFAAFTLEEYGFIGSRHFIEQARAAGREFSGMISLEMVGFSSAKPGSQTYPAYVDASRYPDRGDFIAVIGNEPSARLTQAVAWGMRGSAPGLAVEHLVVPGRGDLFREVNLSDHSPFWQNGTPAVMITDTAFLRNPNYHQATDTLDTLDLALIDNVTLGVSGFLKSYLGSSHEP